MPASPQPATRVARLRRSLTVALYLGCFVAAGLIVDPLIADQPPAVAGPIVAPPDADDPLFTPAFLPAGTWRIVDANGPAGADWERNARAAVGAVSADQFHLSALLPAGVRPEAVRVDEAGKPTAVFTGPVDPPAAVAAWEAAGWTVAARGTGDRQMYRLTRGGATAVAWVLPRASAARLLVAWPRAGATPTGGFDR